MPALWTYFRLLFCSLLVTCLNVVLYCSLIASDNNPSIGRQFGTGFGVMWFDIVLSNLISAKIFPYFVELLFFIN